MEHAPVATGHAADVVRQARRGRIAVDDAVDGGAPRALANPLCAEFCHARDQIGTRAARKRATLDRRKPSAGDLLHLGQRGAECRQVAYAIAHSPLVKTAFFASDPNLGRILAAVGYAGIEDLDQTGIDLYLDDVHVAVKGGRNPAYKEEDGQRVMKKSEITVRVVLGRGEAADTVWTCDLSHDYVSINADYRS